MNRTPVSGRRLRQIVENTGYKYVAAFERRDSNLLLCVKIGYANMIARQDMDWVDQDTWQVWPATRGGVTVPFPQEITRTVAN